MMLRALTDFPCEVDGELVLIEKGEHVSSKWPGLTDCRHLFEAVIGPGSDADTRSEVRAYDGLGNLLDRKR